MLNRSLIKTEFAERANQRADCYSLLMRIFGNIPNEALLREIKSQSFQFSLSKLAHLDDSLKPHIESIYTFLTGEEKASYSDTIKVLFNDRVNIITGLSDMEQSPGSHNQPDNNSPSSIILNVTYFPLAEDEIPNERISNILDNLCIELDYMSYLCRQEYNQSSSEPGALKTIAQEADFIRDDLGSKTLKFCTEAIRHTSTQFYGGFIRILNDFVTQDLKYLNDLLLKVGLSR